MISYRIQHNTRSHNIRIKIMPDGEVVVVAPRICPTFLIDRFVKSHQAWIEEHVAKMKSRPAPKKNASNEITVFGKTYKKVIEDSLEEKIGVRILGSEIRVNPVSNTATSIEKSVNQFLKGTAEKYITPRTHQLATKMGISFNNLSYKSQKTRWGSCSSQGNLNFNWKLVHCPPAVIDYVIVHELAHRKEMNHSNKFWDIVRKFDPEYLKHRGWLEREGMDLG
jgi:predicted metal-dependent hydrolase